MPPPYDSVVSIGGQSLVDGVWRLLGPALQGITNPLPIAIPGLSNAQMRVTQIVPEFPGNPPATGGLKLRANVELVAEALLHVVTSSDQVNIALGDQDFDITSLTGDVDLSGVTAALSNLTFTGGLNVGTGSGALAFPNNSLAPLSNVVGAGTIDLPDNLALPAIPLPRDRTGCSRPHSGPAAGPGSDYRARSFGARRVDPLRPDLQNQQCDDGARHRYRS